MSVDIRQQGSRNIGAANVKRVAGLKLGLLTLACDALKGATPVLSASAIFGRENGLGEIYLSLVSTAAFAGHLYPVFLKFKGGGKGVATAAGCFLVLSPAALCASLLVYIAVVWISRRASLGSLAASAILSPAVWAAARSPALTVCAVLITAAIFFRHKDNIKRLLAGTEPAIWGKNE
jgi:glycerol-3-phosphate acyltransferase PlsY